MVFPPLFLVQHPCLLSTTTSACASVLSATTAIRPRQGSAVGALSVSCWAVADHVTKGKGNDDDYDYYYYCYIISIIIIIIILMMMMMMMMKTSLLVNTPFGSTCPNSFNSSQHFQELQPNSSTLGASDFGEYATTISGADTSTFRTPKKGGN